MSFTDFFWTSYEGLPLHARDYAPAGGTPKLPVICLHGLTRNARDFEELAPRIAAMGGLITMVLTSLKPEAIAAAVLNDVGPDLSPVGLARIAGYTGMAGRFEAWDAAVAYAKAINEAAFPGYGPEDWDVFARRLFDEKDGGYVLAYDPDISAPIKAAAEAAAKSQDAGAQALAPPDMYPLFRALAKDRSLLLVRGGISDLVDPAIAERMRAAAPHMAYAEVPGVGHAPMLTEPEAWAAIENLLDEAP